MPTAKTKPTRRPSMRSSLSFAASRSLGKPKLRVVADKARPSVRESEYARIHRLLKIIYLIQGRQGWNTKSLAKECDVTERTIFRDMKMMEGAGIPIYFDRDQKGYFIRKDYFLKPLELTLDEALALVALGDQVGGKDQIPFTRPATRAVAKIRSQLPEKIRRELDGLDHCLYINLAQASDGQGVQDVYDKVRLAIQERRTLRCRYESPAGQGNGQEFLFEPYRLLFSQRAWYAVGYHRAHEDVRCLKLSRFEAIEATDLTYNIPAGFSLRKFLGHAWRMIRGSKTYDVTLYFDPAFAETIAETHWHDTQEIEWQADGSILFRCKVDGLDEIVWWVLSMGPHCTVRAPRELADRVGELARQMAGMYNGKL